VTAKKATQVTRRRMKKMKRKLVPVRENKQYVIPAKAGIQKEGIPDY